MMLTAIRRAVTGKCPKCGEGRLFKAYLRQVESCTVCGEKLGDIRADDGPAWFTVLVVGHAMVPSALSLKIYTISPLWLPMTVWPLLAVALGAVVLPFAKAMFIAIIWHSRHHKH